MYFCICFLCQNVNTEDVKLPWYETIPLVTMDFKVHLEAGKEECFFQYVQKDAAFYVNFQVSKNLRIRYSYKGRIASKITSITSIFK